MSPPEVWMQTLKGRAMDMLAPTAAMVDLTGEVAEVLARIPRFGGHVGSGPYSVAQHSVLGCDAILAETGDTDLAGAFILHDAQETYIHDIATPTAQALSRRAGMALARLMPGSSEKARQVGQKVFSDALKGLKSDLDAAIFAAAGVKWPLPADTAAKVHEWDVRMLQVERAHLLAPSPFPWDPSVECVPPARLRERIRVWPWPEAADAYRARLLKLFPHLLAARVA